MRCGSLQWMSYRAADEPSRCCWLNCAKHRLPQVWAQSQLRSLELVLVLVLREVVR